MYAERLFIQAARSLKGIQRQIRTAKLERGNAKRKIG